jgi:nondiscriminating glutamyl-tRNA synthetase
VIRTRFAPSPTGALHVGNARIAVLNWLFSRHHGGVFILRIEDTDVDRNVAGAEAGIRRDLLWLGLEWDEGPEHGAHGPYRQSERGAIYRRYAQRLEAAGAAYWCFCAAPAQEDEAAVERRARCDCATLDPSAARQRADGEPAALRFRVPAGTVAFDDTARGRIEVQSADISDFVLIRSDGRPTYNFAVVVDDLEMRISHVIRGSGHLSNTPRQVLLFDAFERARPVFVHVPMVLGADRQKLSKRHGASGIDEYRTAGHHPDALINYLSLLSWSSTSGREVMTPSELIAEVSLERIGAADVIFDDAKLRWLSMKHIALMPLPELVSAVRPFIAERFTFDDERLRAAVAATRTHLQTFADINEQLDAFFPPAGAPPEAQPAVVAAALQVLSETTSWDEPELKNAVQQIGAAARVSGRALYEPLRMALTGRAHGPALPAVLFVQGRERVLERLAASVAADA